MTQGPDLPPTPPEGAGATQGSLWPDHDGPEELAAMLEYSEGPEAIRDCDV